MTENEFLMKDPLVIRTLIDGYLTGKVVPTSSSGFPVDPDARIAELKLLQSFMQHQPLQSRLIADIGPTEYRLAKKVVKTYETNFKGIE